MINTQRVPLMWGTPCSN